MGVGEVAIGDAKGPADLGGHCVDEGRRHFLDPIRCVVWILPLDSVSAERCAPRFAKPSLGLTLDVLNQLTDPLSIRSRRQLLPTRKRREAERLDRAELAGIVGLAGLRGAELQGPIDPDPADGLSVQEALDRLGAGPVGGPSNESFLGSLAQEVEERRCHPIGGWSWRPACWPALRSTVDFRSSRRLAAAPGASSAVRSCCEVPWAIQGSRAGHSIDATASSRPFSSPSRAPERSPAGIQARARNGPGGGKESSGKSSKLPPRPGSNRSRTEARRWASAKRR